MLELLDRAPDTTAVLAYNDLMAIGALRAIRRRGRSVPGDMSVVGFDDVALAAYVDPPLTTLSQSTAEMGYWAVERLTERIRARGASADGMVRIADRSRLRRRSSSCRSGSRCAVRPVRRRAAEPALGHRRRGTQERLGRVHGPDLADLGREHRSADPLPRAPHEHGRPVRHAIETEALRRRGTRRPPRSAGPAIDGSGGGRRWPVAGPRPGGRQGTCRRHRSGRSRASSRSGR